MSTTSYVQDKAAAKPAQSGHRFVLNFIALATSLLVIVAYFDTLISITILKSDGSVTKLSIDSLGKIQGNSGYQNLASYNSGFGIYLLISSIILSILLLIRFFANNKKIAFYGFILSFVLLPLSLINAHIITSVVINSPSTGSLQTHIDTVGILYIPVHYVSIVACIASQSPLLNKKQKSEKIGD